MNVNKAPSFLKGGYPMFTIKYPTPTPSKSCCLHDLTFTSKTVSFHGMNSLTLSWRIYDKDFRMVVPHPLFPLWMSDQLSSTPERRQ